MKWKKSRLGGCHVVIAEIISIDVYKSLVTNRWSYYLCNHKSVLTYKTMNEAKKDAFGYCKSILARGLAELEKGEIK